MGHTRRARPYPAGLGPPWSVAGCEPCCSDGLQVLTPKLRNGAFSTFKKKMKKKTWTFNLYGDTLTGCVADGFIVLSVCSVEVAGHMRHWFVYKTLGLFCIFFHWLF